MEWYYSINGEQLGPVSESKLFDIARQGDLSPDDLVWNSSMGEEWQPASSIPNLIPTDPSTEAVTGPPPIQQNTAEPYIPAYDGITHNRDLMAMARDSLAGNWATGVLVMLLYSVVVSGSSNFIPVVGWIISLFLAGPMMLGLYKVFLQLARRQPTKIEQLFDGFKRFGTAMGAYLLINLYVMLWLLLLIIPGIIAGYAYSMTFYIMNDDETLGPNEAITLSKEMMRGNKLKLFCLYWRFFGWGLLCILTLGIGFLWLGPYTQTAMAHFYEDIRDRGRTA